MKAARRAEVRALMARVLPDGERLAAEYPLAFDDRFGGEFVALEEHGAVRSACTILPRDFVCGAKTVKIGLIGSVVTDPGFRRRGLMTRLLDDAEARLAELGCAFGLLWAEDPNVYSSRGYAPFGHEIDYWADEAFCAALWSIAGPVARVRAAVPADAEAIHELYSAHALRVQRSREETRALLACPDMEVLVLPLAHAGHELEGYTCVGRGRDLANVVHEWGGSSAAVLALVRGHQERRLARGVEPELVLMTSSAPTPLNDVLEALGARRFDGILGLAKPLDPAWLASELMHAAHGLSVTVARGPDGARALLAQSPHARRELPLGQAMQALFPPGGDLGAFHHVTDTLRTSLRGWPLRPFAWGLDSI